MLRKQGKRVFWPAYIDKNKTRAKGRIIPRRLAVPSPTIVEIEEAAVALGLSPEVEVDKSYPRSWWERSGRLLFESDQPKSRLALKMAERILKKREKKAAKTKTKKKR